MNLVSRCSERIRDVLLSVTSEILGKTRHESQSPLSPQAEITIERGNLLEERTRHKHVSLVNTRTLFWKKKITIERGDPLFAPNEERLNSSLKTTKQIQICR